MNNRRNFLAAGGALGALTASLKANADQPHAFSIYLHGMVWNRQLTGPMNDWLVRFDAKVDIPIGTTPPPVTPGFATIGDDFHDGVGSHIRIHSANLKADNLSIEGAIIESKTPALLGQPVRIEGKLVGDSVEGLTLTIGPFTFTGAGLLVKIAIIAILIGL